MTNEKRNKMQGKESDKKDLNFDIYKDSSENDLENGRVVFKIS